MSKGKQRKVPDLVGQTIGKWTVLKESGRDSSGKVMFLCRCECDREYRVAGVALWHGTSTQCSLCARHGRPKLVAIDLTGQKIGRWTVLERIPAESHGGHLKYLCRCECGNERLVLAANLRQGKSTQCAACSQRERRRIENPNKMTREQQIEFAKHTWNTPSYPRLLHGHDELSPNKERQWKYSGQDYLNRMHQYERKVAR